MPRRERVQTATDTKRSWFKMQANDDGTAADIAIYDVVGSYGDSAPAFRDALQGLGKDVKQINLRINSPGGEVFDGIAIHNMLARHPAHKVVSIDGLAASIASLIAMAGDEIQMPENAMMMIHNPGGFVMGTADDMRDVADSLDTIRDSIVSSYVRKSGQDAEAITKLMDAETWMSAQEALKAGFADKVMEPAKVTNLFDLGKFKHPPQNVARTQESNMTTVNNNAAGTGTGAATTETTQAASTEQVPATETTAAATTATTTQAATTAAAAATNAGNGGTATPPPVRAAATVADPVAEERDRCANISAACEVAGWPAKASEFIDKGNTLGEVLAELRGLPRRPPAQGVANNAEVNARHNPAQTDDVSAGWKRIIDRKNAQVR